MLYSINMSYTYIDVIEMGISTGAKQVLDPDWLASGQTVQL